MKTHLGMNIHGSGRQNGGVQAGSSSSHSLRKCLIPLNIIVQLSNFNYMREAEISLKNGKQPSASPNLKRNFLNYLTGKNPRASASLKILHHGVLLCVCWQTSGCYGLLSPMGQFQPLFKLCCWLPSPAAPITCPFLADWAQDTRFCPHLATNRVTLNKPVTSLDSVSLYGM